MELIELMYFKLGDMPTGGETYLKMYQPEVIEGELSIPIEFRTSEGVIKMTSVPLNIEHLRGVLRQLEE